MKKYLIILLVVNINACISTHGSNNLPDEWRESVNYSEPCKDISGDYHVTGIADLKSSKELWKLSEPKRQSLVYSLGLTWLSGKMSQSELDNKYRNVTHMSIDLKEDKIIATLYDNNKTVEKVDVWVIPGEYDVSSFSDKFTPNANCYEEPLLQYRVNRDNRYVFLFKNNDGDLIARVNHISGNSVFYPPFIYIDETTTIHWYRFNKVENGDALKSYAW